MKALDPNRPQIYYPFVHFLRDVWNYLGSNKQSFVVGSFARLASDIIWLYPAIALGKIVDFLAQYNTGDALNILWTQFAFLCLASITSPILRNYGKALIFRASIRSNQTLRIKAATHLMHLSSDWHEKESSGGKFQRLNTAADSLGVVYSHWVNNIIEVGVNLVGVPVVLLGLDPTIGFSSVFFVVLYIIIQLKFTGVIANIQHTVNLASEVAAGNLFEAIANVRTTRVLGAIGKVMSGVSESIRKFVDRVAFRIGRARSQVAILNLFFQIFRILMYAFAIIAIIGGKYEVGFLMVLTTYLQKLWESTDELGMSYQELTVAKYGLARVRELFDAPIVMLVEEGKIALSRNWKKLKIEHLSFAYGENEVLNDISFTISRGEKVGIVGLSGAGKSTLFKLLLKEYEDYKGEIKFDDLSLREVSPKDYYAHTAVVLQDTEVFNFSLKDNITIGREKFDRTAFERALDVAHVRDFLHKLPQGVDTLIGEKGVKLSGGEKQRLGIARAVYKSPELLLLDEATSHLDIESEKDIQDSLHEFFQSVTAVVIAHRLTTIKEMDRIIVIENGKIKESGSFAGLMKKKRGRFKELWKKQKI